MFLYILMTFAVLNCVHSTEILCGSRWMDNSNNICCGGHIHEKVQNSVEMACCDLLGKSEVYQTDEKICCGQQLIPKQPGQHLECCNKELIDVRQYVCCGDEFFGMKYRYSSGRCCVDWDNRTAGVHVNRNTRLKCCSTTLYNKDAQRCTVGPNGQKLIESKTSMRTCGTTQYDSRYSLCCSQTGKVIPKAANKSGTYQPEWVCWNGESYDSKIYYLDDKTSEVFLKGLARCGKDIYSLKSKDLKCCGNRLIPVTPEKNLTCCGNDLWDLDDTSKTCCNGTFISTATKACCNDVAYDAGYDIKCCAKILYNKTTDICCESQSSYHAIIHKQKPHHTNCCKSAETDKMETYSKYTEVCDRGQVREKRLHEPDQSRNLRNENLPSKNLHTVNLPQKPGRNEIKSCPFCKFNNHIKICDKKHVYKFFVFAERQTSSGTILSAIILEPYLRSGELLNGEKVKIRTKHQCDCFKPRRNFYLFTNRKIKSFKENRYNIRFTSDDVFIRQPETSLSVDCVKRHLSGTHWKEFH